MSSTSEETDPSEQRAADSHAANALVTFNRLELNRILNLYGRMVAAGEWRDYAIDFLRDRAVFSVFRRASEVPIYRIEKDPRLSRKQGAYSVISASGMILPDMQPGPHRDTKPVGWTRTRSGLVVPSGSAVQ